MIGRGTVPLLAFSTIAACGGSDPTGPCVYQAISAAATFSTGLRGDGNVWAWGVSPLANAPVDSRPGPSNSIHGDDNVEVFRRNETAPCSRKTDGSVHCIRSNPQGAGDLDMNLGADIAVLAQGRDAGVFTSPASEWNCVLRTSGGIDCWRSNLAAWQLIPVDLGLEVVDLALGLSGPSDAPLDGVDGCAITSDHALWCWGRGVLGDGVDFDQNDFLARRPPTEITSLRGQVAKVALGQERKCAITLDHRLYCWGDTNYASVGRVSPPDLEPVEITALGANVADVDMGQFHTCALTVDDRVFCFGENSSGEVTGGDTGSGQTLDYTTPREVTALGTEVAQVVTGYRHSCARKTDGSAWCWGNNNFGQLGHPPVGQYVSVDPVPRQVIGCPAQ